MADVEAVVRAVEAWGAPAWPNIWRPFREHGIGVTAEFVEQAETALRAEPSLVRAWHHFVEDKRFTASWALDGARVFWVPSSATLVRGPERTFDDGFRACAEYVLRESRWSLERTFVDLKPGPGHVARTWSLMDGDRLLGLLTVTDYDWPWLSATFAATAAFEAWRPLFDEERRLVEQIDDRSEEWESAYSVIAKALTLREPDGRAVKAFLLHVDGEAAWWRWT